VVSSGARNAASSDAARCFLLVRGPPFGRPWLKLAVPPERSRPIFQRPPAGVPPTLRRGCAPGSGLPEVFGGGSDNIPPAMSAENEAYREGQQLLRQLAAWEQSVTQIDASDTQCKTDVLLRIEEARRQLKAALSRLAGLV